MTADARDPEDLAADDRITVTVEDGLYVAEDAETGISSQGQSEAAALENLAAALETYREGLADDADGWF